jgi:hypothetical protein
MNASLCEWLLDRLRAARPLRIRWARDRAAPHAKSATLCRNGLRWTRRELRRSERPPACGAPGTIL